MRRSRWLGLYVRIADHDAVMSDFVLHPMPIRTSTVGNFDASLTLPAHEHGLFQPTPKEAALYFEPNLMPGKLRKWSKQEILQYRLPEEKLHTFMAAYGEQHNIRPDLLGTHGLLGFFRREHASFRFWTPMEIGLLHGLFHGLTLLKPAKLAWHSLGNCITPIHAIYVLFHAFQILGDFHEPLQLDQLFDDFLEGRIRVSDISNEQDECAWYVGTKIETSLLRSRVQFFMAQMSWTTQDKNYWPSGMFFSPTEGLKSVQQESIPGLTLVDSDVTMTTAPFVIDFEVMPFLIPGEYGILKVHGSTTWRTLLNLWKFQLQPTDFAFDWSQIDETLQDTMPVIRSFLKPVEELSRALQQTEFQPQAIPKVPVLLRASTDLHLYEVDKNTTWKKFRQEVNVPNIQFFHSTGAMHDSFWISHPVEIADHQPDLFAIDGLLELLPLLTKISIEITCPTNTDIVCMHCQGPMQSYDAFRLVWDTPDTRKWLAAKGRQANIQRTDDCTWRLLLRPLLPNTATPGAELRELLFVRILQKMLLSIQVPTGIECIFKHMGQALTRGHYASELSLAPIWAIVKHAYAILEPNRQPSLLSSGKICADACCFQDLLDRKLRPGTVIVTLSLPMLGGGPTSKQDFLKLVESDAAAMFLEYGMHLSQVPNMTAKLVDSIGTQRLHHILHGEGGQRKYQSFEASCKATGIDLPQTTRLSQLKAKHRRANDRKSNKSTMNPDPDQFQLQEGFFLNSDGTAANLLAQFSPNSSGVMMMSANKARDWLLATADLATDELGLYVLGPIEVPTKFESTAIHAPATNAMGQPVLLNGCLIQLGAKKLKTATEDNEKIKLQDVRVASITVWKEDWDAQMWTAITTTPVKTLKQLLALDGHQGLFGKPWARTFQDKGIQVEPALATSFQVHGEFDNSPRFAGLLKKSGFNKIYITPKDDTGKPHPAWKVIWLDQTAVQIEARTSTIAGTAGLVRGRKSLGIRIETGFFQNAWAKLKPGESQPDLRQTALVFKLQPLPQGTTADSLVAWGALCNWDIKPIKALGAKQWVIGSDVPPPPILQFNGQPILAQQLYQKGRDQSAIVAGPRKVTTQPKQGVETSNIFKTGDSLC